jgi:hypothetical protein
LQAAGTPLQALLSAASVVLKGQLKDLFQRGHHQGSPEQLNPQLLHSHHARLAATSRRVPAASGSEAQCRESSQGWHSWLCWE